MRTSKIQIRNLFGISEQTLDGRSVEITGPKGAGKTSVLDSIRVALTNKSDRDFVIRQGADEGEIILETDTGLVIDRKIRTNKADSIKVRDGSLTHTRPAEFLSQIFTPLQLNPIEFTEMSRQEKNRVILNLIEFDWDIGWIEAQFGEVPKGVDYSKHILEVLAEIQSEKGVYYQSRQNINRDIRNNLSLIEEIARDIPDGYRAETWEIYDLSDAYHRLEKMRETNSRIDRARGFRAAYDNKVRGLEAERQIARAAEERAVACEREDLSNLITRLREQIAAAEDKLSGLDSKLSDKLAVIDAKYREGVAKLDSDSQIAAEWADRQPEDTAPLAAEVRAAEAMKKHLNEYFRMKRKQEETDALTAQSEELTRKIELARELPSEILAKAHIPVKGLTVENGIPLVNGLPVSNLSDGELLELCVDVSVSKPGKLEIILIDGMERLDSESRARLYEKCREKGLQIIATRVTDGDCLEVTVLDDADAAVA